MPIYEYQCEGCGQVRERQLSIKDMEAGFQVWCSCGAPCRKVPSLPASCYPGANHWRKWDDPGFAPGVPPEAPPEYHGFRP